MTNAKRTAAAPPDWTSWFRPSRSSGPASPRSAANHPAEGEAHVHHRPACGQPELSLALSPGTPMSLRHVSPGRAGWALGSSNALRRCRSNSASRREEKSKEQRRRLDVLAKREGKTLAEVVREAVDAYVAQAPPDFEVVLDKGTRRGGPPYAIIRRTGRFWSVALRASGPSSVQSSALSASASCT